MPTFQAVIDRFEDKTAVLALGNDHIVIPLVYLPADCAAGTTLTITIQTDADVTELNHAQAKNILNEILNTGSSA